MNASEPKELIHFEPGGASAALTKAYGCVFLGGVRYAIVSNGKEQIGDVVGWVSAQDQTRGDIDDYVVFSVEPGKEPAAAEMTKHDLWAVSIAELSVAQAGTISQLEVSLDAARWAAYNPLGEVQDRPVITGPRRSSLSKDPSKTYLGQIMKDYAPSTPKMSAVTFQSVPEGAQLWLEGSYVDDTITGFVMGRERAQTMQMAMEGYKACTFSDAIEVPQSYGEYILACNLVQANPSP